MTKTQSLTVTGIIEKCSVEQGPHPDPYVGKYAPQNEYYSLYLDITLRLDDGTAVYFHSPRAEMSVANCPVCAIVLYDLPGRSGDWMREINTESRVAAVGRPNTNTVEPTVKIGQRITISGRVKADRVSKAGRPYKVLNYVKLVK